MLFVMLLFGVVLFISGTDIEKVREFTNDESDKF